jgi:hypothetical protein
VATPLVSVVVPVYNTSAWLQEAFDSIDRQACRDDVEVVVIDDGSTDESPRIAQNYARKAPNVRYVRQENAGLGSARNHGMRLASGRYLGFLDSDDIYPPGGLDAMTALIEEHRADIVVGDMHGFPPRPSPRWRRELVIGQRTITSLAEAPDLVGNPSACNKVFRRDFVEAHGVRFTEGTAFEDVLFVIPLMLRSSRTVVTPRLAYLYRQRGDGSSIMDGRDQPVKIMQHLGVVERLMAEAAGADEGARRAVQRWVVYMQLSYARRAVRSLDDEELTEFIKRMTALFQDVPVETVSEFVHSMGGGLQAVAIYEQDMALLQTPQYEGPLRVVGGQVYGDHPAFERYHDLLRAQEPTANFAWVRRDPEHADSVVVGGSCHFGGLGVEPDEIRPDLFLEVGDPVIRRPLVITKLSGRRIHWICPVPFHNIPAGDHHLRLVVRDVHGPEMVIPVGAVTDRTRPVFLAGRRNVWLRAAKPEPKLVVTKGTVATAVASMRYLKGGGRAIRRRSQTTANRVAARVRRQLSS